MDICICITDSLCCTAETNTILYINYTLIKTKKKNPFPSTLLLDSSWASGKKDLPATPSGEGLEKSLTPTHSGGLWGTQSGSGVAPWKSAKPQGSRWRTRKGRSRDNVCPWGVHGLVRLPSSSRRRLGRHDNHLWMRFVHQGPERGNTLSLPNGRNLTQRIGTWLMEMLRSQWGTARQPRK